MNVLQKCCVQTIRKNPRRTVVTVIGIIVSTALIMVVSTLFMSMVDTVRELSASQSGDYHYLFRDVAREDLQYFEHHQNLESYGLLSDLGYAEMEFDSTDRKYLCVKALWNEDAAQRLSLKPQRGRLPQTDDEILLSYNLYMDRMVQWEIGDQITLALLGERMADGAVPPAQTPDTEGETPESATEKTYTIVGIADWGQAPVENDWKAQVYYAYTIGTAQTLPERVDVYAKYTKWGLHHHEQVTSGILGISEELFEKYFFILPDRKGQRKVFHSGAGWDQCTPSEREQATKFTSCLYRQENLVSDYLYRLSDLKDPEFMSHFASSIAH